MVAAAMCESMHVCACACVSPFEVWVMFSEQILDNQLFPAYVKDRLEVSFVFSVYGMEIPKHIPMYFLFQE